MKSIYRVKLSVIVGMALVPTLCLGAARLDPARAAVEAAGLALVDALSRGLDPVSQAKFNGDFPVLCEQYKSQYADCLCIIKNKLGSYVSEMPHIVLEVIAKTADEELIAYLQGIFCQELGGKIYDQRGVQRYLYKKYPMLKDPRIQELIKL